MDLDKKRASSIMLKAGSRSQKVSAFREIIKYQTTNKKGCPLERRSMSTPNQERE